jgi:hypothetical protein
MSDTKDAQKSLIWEEYKYRHEHIWATIFKLTAAASLISVAPYIHREVACVLGLSVLLLPLLALSLCVFGYARLARELLVLDTVKKMHRELQGTTALNEGGSFTRHAKLFVAMLCLVVLLNGVVLGCVWVSAAGGNTGKGAACFVQNS